MADTCSFVLSSSNTSSSQRTTRACYPCQLSHSPCTATRPCTTCSQRGIPERCVDGVRKVAKYLLQDSVSKAKINSVSHPTSPEPQTTELSESPTFIHNSIYPSTYDTPMMYPSLEQKLHISKIENAQSGVPNEDLPPLPYFDPSDLLVLYEDEDGLSKLLSRTQSEHAKPASSDRSPATNDVSAKFAYDNVNVPFPYRESNHALIKYVESRLEPAEKTRLWKALSKFRPSILDKVRKLTSEDLIFMERCFQRFLIEGQSLISMTGTPACLWRRSGELVAVNKEFCFITGLDAQALLSKPVYIYELMDSASLLDYWEAFSNAACDAGHNSIHLSCRVQTSTPGIWMHLVSWISIKRCIFDIPLVVVAHFMPSF
jgi:hypothetical protein